MEYFLLRDKTCFVCVLLVCESMPFLIFWTGSFAVRYGDLFRYGIICHPIWGSFAVPGSFVDAYSIRFKSPVTVA